ncbi:protein crumbs homolog 1 [Brachionichthys hirsutus]|uniref:protein crumbs homolog 1 n=1 Tax=Brachionichthys hirsutus TaxID=412623 RepID=UPI003604BF92
MPQVCSASPDSLPSAVGRCSPNPCRNRALCRGRGDGYSCFCVPGFQGAHCQVDVNECVSQPCRNGATCVDRVGRFSCLCSAGFTGVTCEVQIDECQSQPCLHGGSCHGYTGGFACTCTSGFQGHRCEINIDECLEQPCRNGAECIDGANDYRCDCSHTAFTGSHCEIPLPACHSEPCYNSAICQDNQGNYTCECWPGFAGRQCEVDIDECGSSPCMHGGLCMERSRRAVHGREPLLPGRFDQRHAAGYICSCPPGTTGSICQEAINQCASGPCRNGGRCENHVGGYACHCPAQSLNGFLYGGVNCDERLVGCEGHQCQNGGSCSPVLLNGTHGYLCSCLPGHSGPLCMTSTVFSFERRGYLRLQGPLVDAGASCNITVSFKTVHPRALLFQRGGGGGLLLSLELDEGLLHLTLRMEAPAAPEGERPSQVLLLPRGVVDGEWHSVEAVLGNGEFSLKLLHDAGSCGSRTCNKSAGVEAPPTGLALSPQSTFIGGTLPDASRPAFIGCMRDVFVDRQLVVPQGWPSDSAVNVLPGCSHGDRCLDAPCQRGARCVNLWQSYQCLCPRPYEGRDCEDEHVPARFGSEDSRSYAAFTITDHLGDRLSVSLFLRTRTHSGLLLALANSSSQYLRVWLEEGKVTVQLAGFRSLKAGGAVDDGEVHFVSVEVEEGRMQLFLAAREQGHVGVQDFSVQAGHTVLVGGLLGGRMTSVYGGYFKGCIQDLRINDRRLQFFGSDASARSYPLELMENVTAGCSGGNACRSNPCLNGGTCSSMWDDFACTCPPKTAGRRCEEVKWCELSPCPADTECRTLEQGYECYSNATFLNRSTVLSFQGNGRTSRNLTSLSLKLRTRSRDAAVLHAEKAPAFVTLSVRDGFLSVELQSAAGDGGQEAAAGSAPSSLSSRTRVNDNEWHSVDLFMAAPWEHASEWTLVLDGDVEAASTSRDKEGNLDFLRQGADIFLGGLPHASGWFLTGCLSTVELGGVALPYLSSSDVSLPRIQEQFAQTSSHPPLLGCSGAPVCEPNPCRNGGRCRDLFNAYNCSCAEGWAGSRCDFFTDTCASGPCVHGSCSVHGPAYQCACELGFAGVDCDEEVGVCADHLCAHGGTCLQGPDRYACLCPENYTGALCNERIEEIPWYIVVRKVPKLPVSVCGDAARNYTCFNGGNCTDRPLSCDCPPGFLGHRCEQEVDECESNPCLNGGYCRNLVDKFACVCDMSYAGDVCQTDLTSEGLNSDLLLSVSLVSVVLLLVLIVTSVGLVGVALSRRATHGAYNPSRQEKEGSRVEMWSITQPPPVERLI